MHSQWNYCDKLLKVGRRAGNGRRKKNTNYTLVLFRFNCSCSLGWRITVNPAIAMSLHQNSTNRQTQFKVRTLKPVKNNGHVVIMVLRSPPVPLNALPFNIIVGVTYSILHSLFFNIQS